MRTGAGVVAAVLAMAAPGLTLAGCGGPYGSGPLSQQVTRWATSTGFTASLARLRGDLAHVASAGGDAGALRTACDVLVTDSLSANEQLPAPDGALTSALSDAYGTAATAGRDCFRGAGGDPALLAKAERERTTALAQLVRAEARYDAVTSPLPGSGS